MKPEKYGYYKEFDKFVEDIVELKDEQR